MELQKLRLMPLWQMTGDEFLLLQKNSQIQITESKVTITENKRYVYGIKGLSTLLGCSKSTADRIKKSKVIDQAVTQIGRKIIIEADLALKLAGRKNGGRK